MKPTMTPKEAAIRLQLSLNQIYGLIDQNVIPSRRLGLRGGKILLDRVDVEAYWEAAKQPRQPAEPEIIPASRHLRHPSLARRQA